MHAARYQSVLHLDAAGVKVAVALEPRLLGLDPDSVQRKLGVLAAAIGITEQQAAAIAARKPCLLLLSTDTLSEKLQVRGAPHLAQSCPCDPFCFFAVWV